MPWDRSLIILLFLQNIEGKCCSELQKNYKLVNITLFGGQPWTWILQEHILLYMKKEVFRSSQYRFAKDNSQLTWLSSMTKMAGSLGEERILTVIYLVFSKAFGYVSFLGFQVSFWAVCFEFRVDHSLKRRLHQRSPELSSNLSYPIILRRIFFHNRSDI